VNCSSLSPIVAVDSWAWLTRRSGDVQWSPCMGGVLPPARCSAVKAAWVKIEESKSRISRWIWAVGLRTVNRGTIKRGQLIAGQLIAWTHNRSDN